MSSRQGWRGLIGALTVLVVLGIAGRSVEARDDWQLWLQQKWSVTLSPTLKLAGKTEERWRSDMDDFFTHVVSVGPSWKARPWLKLEPTLHYQWTEQAGRDANEQRVFLNVTPGWSWGRVHVEDRHRTEFRHINGRDDWRYRNRPKLSVEMGRDWYEVEPYVSDEVFYGHRAGEWQRNRFTAGVEKPLTEELGVELSYLIESNKSGSDWNEFHVLGIAASMAF